MAPAANTFFNCATTKFAAPAPTTAAAPVKVRSCVPRTILPLVRVRVPPTSTSPRMDLSPPFETVRFL